MEADGSSSPVCEYCGLTGHQRDYCKERIFDRRVDCALGCAGSLLLAPAILAGWIAGTFATGFRAGFKAGFSVGAWVRARIDRWRKRG